MKVSFSPQEKKTRIFLVKKKGVQLAADKDSNLMVAAYTQSFHQRS